MEDRQIQIASEIESLSSISTFWRAPQYFWRRIISWKNP